jgi:hypothetical protein
VFSHAGEPILFFPAVHSFHNGFLEAVLQINSWVALSGAYFALCYEMTIKSIAIVAANDRILIVVSK